MTPSGAPTGAVRVVNTFPLSDDQLDRIRVSHATVELVHRPADDQAAVDDLVDATANVLLADFAPTHRRGLPELEWMQYSGAGVDDLTATAPWRNGLVVTTASGANSPMVAEYVIAAMFDVVQRGTARRRRQAERHWAVGPAQRAPLLARPLAGSTVALVGYGNIGRQIAARASALGMRVLAVKSRPDVQRGSGYGYDRGGDPDGRIPETIVGSAQLADVVGRADFVVIAAPSTERTRGTLGNQVLESMRPGSWLINVGRGDVFDEGALIERIRDGSIAGATLDVANAEPLPADSALWGLDDVVITPHLAGDFGGIWDAITELIVENIGRFATGEALLNVVSPDDGY